MGLAKAFDRSFINVRERPLSGDPNQNSSNADYTSRELLYRLLSYVGSPATGDGTSGVPTGFLADGFKVDPGSGLQVILREGLGFQANPSDVPTNIDSANNLNDQHPLKPLVLSAAQSITVPNADPTNPRIDIVEVQYDRQVLNPQSRDILDTTTGVFVPGLVNKDLVWDLAGLTSVNGTNPINYKTGSPAGSPTEPTVDAGYIKVGAIFVPAAASSIHPYDIGDRRRLLAHKGSITISGTARITLGSTPAIDFLDVDAPPGIGVILGVSGASNSLGSALVSIVGPFPGAAANANAQYGAIQWSAFALTSGLVPLVENPAAITPSISTSGVSPEALFQGLTQNIASVGTSLAAVPSYWATATTSGVNQQMIWSHVSLRQWNGSDFTSQINTSIASAAKVLLSFTATIPIG